MAMQQFLIARILQPLQRLTAGWSDKTKDRVFILCGLCIIFHHFLQAMYIYLYRFLVYFAIDCFFLGIMILCSLRGTLKPVKFRLFPAICWFGIGGWMLLSGILVSENRLPEAVLFLVGYPICFFVWNNMEREKVFSLLSRTCIISFIVYTIINILLYPMGSAQYAGLMLNVNGSCFYLLLVLACLLVELLDHKKCSKKWVLHLVLMGLCVAQIYYTNSRTGYLSAIMTVVFVLVLYFVSHRREKLRFTLVTILACALSIFVCINTAFYLFQVAKLIPDEWTEWLHLVDIDDSDFITDLDGIEDINNDKLSTFGKTLDRISTGRISIWGAFGADLNLFGNVEGKGYFIPILKREAYTTHNTILQFGYESGIPAGVLYLLLNLFSGVYAIIFARRNRGERYALMPFAVTMAFGVMSLFSSLGISFYYMSTFYYYLVQFPLIAKPIEAKVPQA